VSGVKLGYHKVGLYIRPVILSSTCRVKDSCTRKMLKSGGFLDPGIAETSLTASLQRYECCDWSVTREVTGIQRIYSAPSLFRGENCLVMSPQIRTLEMQESQKDTILEWHVVLSSLNTHTRCWSTLVT
jgi:hypothetical protein